MATKEDILEQLVEEYLIHKGFFVRHNLKFLPRKDHPEFKRAEDSNHSDIDVLGLHPKRSGAAAVWAVSCKSWQSGFNPASELAALREGKVLRGRASWKSFRELCVPKWSEAFQAAVGDATGRSAFTYVLAVAKVNGDRSVWEQHEPFREALGGNPIRILTFREIVEEIYEDLGTTLASSEVGRLLQMFRAAGIKL